MKYLVLKSLTIWNILLLATVILPTISFAQAIYGFDQASHFDSSHRGPFSIYAGTFRSKQAAQKLRNRIAVGTSYPVRIIAKDRLYAVVLGPLPSPQVVRTIANSLISEAKVSPERSNQTLISSVTPLEKDSLTPQVSPSTNRMAVTVLLGGNSYIVDKHRQIVFPAETFRTDSFEIEGNKVNFASALGISYERVLESDKGKPWRLLRAVSLGVNAYFNESTRDGSVYEYSLANFNNSTYSMKIRSYRVMLDTEVTLDPLLLGVMPFVEAGLGAAQNTMSFQNIPRPNIGVAGGNYYLSNHASTQFAYEFGAGLKLAVSRFIVSARYLYTDSGKVESRTFDSATGVLLASPIATNIQSQSVLFGLSYLFG